MDAPAQTAPQVALDQEGNLAEDRACIKCAYNLRGLDPAGRCPECGTAIGRSILGDFLRYCDPDWVGTLASGMNWIVAGILIALTLAILGNVATNLFSTPALAALVLVAALITPIVSLVGYWQVTTPDPGRIGQESQLNARVVARFGMVASVALGPSQHLIAQTAPQAAAILGVGGAIVSLVTTFAIFVYARRLALRIPDDHLAGQTRTVMWGLAFSYGLMAIMGVLIFVTRSRFGAGGAPGVGFGVAIMACVGGVIMLIFSIWALILVFRYRRAMLDAAAEARTTWARPA